MSTAVGERAASTPADPSATPRRTRRTGGGPAPWIIPSLVVLMAVSLYPAIYALVTSFRFYNVNISAKPGGFNGIQNYVIALTDAGFGRAVLQTLLFCTVVTAVELILGFLLALLLREPLVGTGIARSLLVIPVSIAPTVAGLAFRSMYTPGTGLIPAVFDKVGIGLPAAGILGSKTTAMPALMITDIWQWTPFITLVMLAALQGVPQDVVEAARMDGASSFRILRSVTVPLISTTIVMIGTLRFIQSFNVFDIVYVETRGGPGGSTSTIGMEIFLAGLNNYNIGLASALTVIATVIVGVFISVYFSLSNRSTDA